MTRPRPRGRGIAAPFESTCWRCDERIDDYRKEVAVKHHGHWIHRTCAPGADDE